ncbi:MAG: S8 family serine peptidase, partial [Bacteroidota bacterium]
MFSNRDLVLIQTIIRNICILGLFLWILPVQAQQEVNVKLKQEGKLSSFLTSYQKSEKSSSTIRQLFPYLEGMSSAQQLHLRKEKSGLERIYNLSFPGSKNTTQLIDLLASSGEFEYVEPNYRRKVHALEMAPMDDSTSAQWYHQFIQTFEAWDLSKGSSDVRIGVLDTGLDFGHPEFEGQIGVNAAEDLNGNGSFEPWPVSENRGGLSGDFDGIDNDQNGFTDDVSGYDFTDQIRSPFVGDYLDPDPNPQDDNNHGTQVAGVIGARADNQIGGVGIAPDCKLVVLRAFSALGMGDDDDIARAIVYAADNGIDVLVMSFGDLFPSITMHEAIKYAYEKGVVLVASAGNATGDELHYPSGFDEVISVSGTIFNEERNEETIWPLSSFGVTVDIAAPASDIFTTFIRDVDGSPAFGRIQGTSFSAPMVASAIGLLFSIRGKLPPRQVQGLLASTADDISIEGWDHFTGAGRLNLFKLLSFSGSSTAEIISPINDEGTSGNVVSIVGTVLDPEFASFSLSWEEGVKGEENWTPIIENQTYQVNADTLTVWDISDLEEGEYTLRLVINKTDGSTLEDRNRFVVDRSSPELKISVSSNAWDNEENKVFIDFRSNDRALHTLHFKKVGESEEKSLKFDQFTRIGHFLLGQESLSPGAYEMRVSATNRAGITGESTPFNISFQPASLPEHGFDSLTYGLPNGRYLPGTYDFDKDGLQEVIYSKYDRALRPGKIFISEFNGSRFVEVDSLDFKPILLPKDVGDTDQDGLLEIFCSISDSSFLVEQA